MLDKAKLRAEILLHGDTQATLAQSLGLSLSRTNAKINEWNGAGFTQKEIEHIGNRYGLSAKKIRDIFFAKRMS